MPFHILKLHFFSAAIITAAISVLPALAAANPPVDDAMEEESKNEHPSSGFAAADFNSDGALNKSEFSFYAGDRAVAGDTDFITLVSSGDYETAFQLMDSDADGSLSVDEVRTSIADHDAGSLNQFDEVDDTDDFTSLDEIDQGPKD